MTLIDRTAYPKFKQYPDPKELAELYTPQSAEIKFAKSRTKSHEGFLCFMVMLKSFQRLGYFPHPECVPNAVIKHLRSCLKLQIWVKAIPSQRQGYTYQRAIRSYLGVKQYDKTAQKLIAILVAQQAEVKDHPADLINVAIEELVKERYELPAFGTLDRLIGHIRTFVNNRLFGRVNNGLSTTEMVYLDQLLLGDIEESIATLNLLKSPPKSATFKGMKQLLTKFDALMSFGDAKRLLGSIALTKIRYFAAQARALDISELRDVNLPKRRTLLLCLLYEAQVKTRDHIVSMFLKRVLKIQNNAKQRLQELREKHLAQTSELLGTLAEVLTASKEAQDAQSLGTKVQSIFDEHGGTDLLLQKYEEIAAYNTNNHLPLMWRFYSPHRKVLFDLVRSLDILSTSADESVIDALSFILDNEHKRGRHLPFEIDLSFVGKQWRALVIQEVNGTQVLVRQQLEICIFSYLADDFKAGDACVVGSLSYADFREQLLKESECEPLISEYCRLVGFPDNAEDFVEHLRKSLTQVAEEVDAMVLSIKAGKVMPSTLLRKLGSYSRKNRLYQSFLELGKVVRTMFLLEYISNMRMRSEINAITNIVEMYHAFLDWVFFGKEGAITENDPIEQEKRLKYLDLVASAVILQNTVDMSLAIQTLAAQGEVIHQRHVAALSPYVNRHIKRYGDYVVNLRNIPQPLEVALSLPPEIFET